MNCRIEIQPLAGRHVVALKDASTGNVVKVFTVNASAAEMLRLYRDGLDIQAIADTFSQKYGVPVNQVHADAKALLETLE